MTKKKVQRPQPGTGKLRPFVFKMEEGERLWVVLFRDEIKYKTGDYRLAKYYAVSLAYVHLS